MKPILVEWYDACSVDDWTEISAAKAEELPKQLTLGFLVTETEHKITVALSWDRSNEQVSQFMVIPKAWIANRRMLRVKY
jgi:hypothetical protein